MTPPLSNDFLRRIALPFLALLAIACTPSARASVTGVDAFFRAGQTFITWKQPEEAGRRYDVYRNGQKIATVGAHTSLNLNASIDRMKLSNTRPPAVYEIPERKYFVIREGAAPLDATTGLFVYTAKSDEGAEYTVVPAGEPPAAGAPRAHVAERIEFPSPVRQNETDFVHWTDHVGTELYPAMDSVPGMAYNFRLRAPKGDGPHPLIGFLHGAFLNYSTSSMGGEAESGAVRIAFDSPIIRGQVKGLDEINWPAGAWYGYNENFGTGRPLEQGKVVDYVVRRVLWTLDWAQRTYPIDPDRVSMRGGSMGGIGSLMLGLLHPDRFAAIHAYIPPLRMENRGGAGGGGFLSAMMTLTPADYVAKHPSVDLPYIIYTAGRTDQIVGWPDKLEFAKALREAKAGFTFYWDLRSHDGVYNGPVPESLKEPPVPWGRNPGRPEMSVVHFSRRQSFPALDKVSVDDDPGTVNFATRPPSARPPLDTPGAGDLIGTFNGAVDWDRDTIVDTADRWEITLRLLPFAGAEKATASVTPRRLQNFKTDPGTVFVFKVTGDATAAGEATADKFGRVTVENIPITASGTRLSLKKL